MENPFSDNISTTGRYRNADVYDKSPYRSRMVLVLGSIIQGLEMMLEDTYPAIQNHENKITAQLFEKFLDDDIMREKLGLKDYTFHVEVPSHDEQFQQRGRSDVKVFVNNRIEYFESTKSNYVIECKRLDGGKHLNMEYVKEGICRFVEEKYTWKNVHKTSAMLGYVINATDIPACVEAINQIGQKDGIASFTEPLTFFSIRPGFEFSYHSKHRTINDNMAEVFHVLFDLSEKILNQQ